MRRIRNITQIIFYIIASCFLFERTALKENVSSYAKKAKKELRSILSE